MVLSHLKHKECWLGWALSLLISICALGCLQQPEFISREGVEQGGAEGEAPDASVNLEPADRDLEPDMEPVDMEPADRDLEPDMEPADMEPVDMEPVDMDLEPDMEPDEPIPCDEARVSTTCSELRPTAVKGVCADASSFCDQGYWTSCEPEFLQNTPRYGEVVGEEILDCLDNDCDGEVDEGLNGVPTLNDWTKENPLRLSRRCHYRPFIDGGEMVTSIDLEPDPRRLYSLDGLIIESGFTLNIRKRADEETGGLDGTDYPAFTADRNIMFNQAGCRIGDVGGLLRLSATDITIEQGAALRADSLPTVCLVSTNETHQSLNGASGGSLLLSAGRALINGELSANGSAPQPSVFFSNVHYHGQLSGGAAGSISLTAPEIILRGSIIARGGAGVCERLRMDGDLAEECDRSPHSGGGPGGEGGAPWEDGGIGGAGSGGRRYDHVDSERGVYLFGELRGVGINTLILPSDGNGDCDGSLSISAQTVSPNMLPIECNPTEGFTPVLYEAVYMVLNERGFPILSEGMRLSIENSSGMRVIDQALTRGVATADRLLASRMTYTCQLAPLSPNPANQPTTLMIFARVLNSLRVFEVPINNGTCRIEL